MCQWCRAKRPPSEVELIASRFHGALAAGHAFAIWFNLRRKNYMDAAVHSAFLLYDAACAVRHHKDIHAPKN